MDNKILIIGVAVLVVAVVLGVITFKILPSNSSIKEPITGAAIEESKSDEEVKEESADNSVLAQIKEGMYRDDVVKIAGEPVDKQTIKTPKGNSVEYWYYESGNTVYQIAFDDTSTVSVVRKY